LRSGDGEIPVAPATPARVTSAEVAQRAGVSQSAVSRVFTPGASASAKTVEKVRRAAAELGYRPNILARAMVSGRSRMIGLVVAYLDNQFYPDVLERLSNALQSQGYHVLVFMASQTAGNIDKVVEEILDYQVDGIIAASVALSSDLSDRCRAAGVPMVLFNRAQDGEGFSSVTSDNFRGGQALADLLLAGGHDRIAYIAGWEGASTQRDRELGFTARLKEAGRTLHAREVGNFRMDEAVEAARRMFEVDPPTGRMPSSSPTTTWRSRSSTRFGIRWASGSPRTCPSSDTTMSPRRPGRPMTSRRCASPPDGW
jgi:DNA-binding LacI/PurR family transcriptional regulator